MGFEFHITKKMFWADDDGQRIDRQSWDRLVKQEASIRHDESNGKDDYLLTIDGADWPLWWHEELGEVYTKNPSESVIEQLKDISDQLGATLQDDDGEPQ